MTPKELAELTELADGARRAAKAAARLNRIALQTVAQLAERLEHHTADSAAEGGNAHDRQQHREPARMG